MECFLLALTVLLAGGAVALLLSVAPRLSNVLGCGAAVCGCILGLVPALVVLSSRAVENFSRAWDVPYGSFSIQIDGLSAFFLVVIFTVCGISAVYGSQCVPALRRQQPGIAWFFYNLMVAAMAIVVVARNGALLATSTLLLGVYVPPPVSRLLHDIGQILGGT